MKQRLSRNTVIYGTILILILLYLETVLFPLIDVYYGTPSMRQVELCKWTDQKTRLGRFQRIVLFNLLYREKGDQQAAIQVIPVLNAHLYENEDEIVRQLVYVTFTTTNATTRRVALSGLLQVSAKHDALAVAAFSYWLTQAESSNLDKDNAIDLSFCISGLAKKSCVDALPRIRQFTNNSNSYLSLTAQNAVKHLEGLRLQPQK